MTFDSFEKKQEEKNSDVEEILDRLVELAGKGSQKIEKSSSGKEIMPAREAAEKMMETEKFLDILSGLIKENREKEEKSHIILATYNRVGKGELDGHIQRPDLFLDIWSGSPDIRLSGKEIKKFFKKMTGNLEKQLMYMEKGPIVIFYGGSGENFNEAVKTIDDLNSLTKLLDKGKKPKFFLLTCRCGIEEKKKSVLPMIQLKRLEGLIYGKEGDCGGFNDFQKITDSLLKEKRKEKMS